MGASYRGSRPKSGANNCAKTGVEAHENGTKKYTKSETMGIHVRATFAQTALADYSS
jgi:hypothetical protein